MLVRAPPRRVFPFMHCTTKPQCTRSVEDRLVEHQVVSMAEVTKAANEVHQEVLQAAADTAVLPNTLALGPIVPGGNLTLFDGSRVIHRGQGRAAGAAPRVTLYLQASISKHLEIHAIVTYHGYG